MDSARIAEEYNQPPTISELVDLALCTPEVGTVNFNILRLLLHDIVEKLGIDNLTVNLGDVETNQIDKYKNYIAGNASNTPMLGVLRVNPQGYSYAVKTVPEDGRKTVVATTPSMFPNPNKIITGPPPGLITPRTGREDNSHPESHQQQNQGERSMSPSGNKTSPASNSNSPRLFDQTKKLEEKVDRLERHLDALYQLPSNSTLLTQSTDSKSERIRSDGTGMDVKIGHGPGMSVNDMWQIIQLNNRVASCESAIQKMATLIEDLAMDLSHLKGDTHSIRGDARNLMNSHSKLSTEFFPLNDKCNLVQEALDELRNDLHAIKHEWKKELENLTKIAGMDISKVPSFMKSKSRTTLILSPKITSPSKRKSRRNRKTKGRGDDDFEDSDKPNSDQSRSTPRSNENSPTTDGPEFDKMTPEAISQYPVRKLANLKMDQLEKITPSLMNLMTLDQIATIKSRIEDLKPKPDINSMKGDEIKSLKLSDLDKLTPEDLASIKPSKMVWMTSDQRKKIDELKSKKKLDFSSMNPINIATVPLSDMARMTSAQAANLDASILQYMTPDQLRVVSKLRENTPPKQRDPQYDVAKLNLLTPGEMLKLSPRQLSNLTDDQLSSLNPQQRALIEQLKKDASSGHHNNHHSHHHSHHHANHASQSHHKNQSPSKSQFSDDVDENGHPIKHQSKHVHGHGHPHEQQGNEGEPLGSFGTKSSHAVHSHHSPHQKEHTHSPVDILRGRIPQDTLPPMTHEDAKDFVQMELQKQYAHLQAQQNSLATDIHDKMEYIYQRLLKEIVTQNESTMPYMAIGNEIEKVLGPGICTGQGMPAGVAVCQFPEADGRQGHGKGTQKAGDLKVCPGPGLCPANANCPHCSAAAAAAGVSGPAYMVAAPGSQGVPAHSHSPHQVPNQRSPTSRSPRLKSSSMAHTDHNSPRRDAEDLLMLKDIRSLVLIDLEKIREEMKISRDYFTFDEGDIVERLDTIWEAIKIVKNNEETLAIKILRQDAFLKLIPKETIERIQKIPLENLDAIAAAKWDRPMMLPLGSIGGGKEIRKDKERSPRSTKGTRSIVASLGKLDGDVIEPTASSIGNEEIQNIYNNLANIIAETTEHKGKLENLGTQVNIMEAGMVTKQMLVDLLADKADKGQINTKVSYDEFGRAIDELHTNLRDLVVEGYSKNEHWKRVTDNLEEEVNDKLDKVELAPLKSFFKSNIKSLDEKVKQLQLQIEEPDPAGTRKKLLRDYNCISCDRHCNISGLTNAPTLPLLGPIIAGHCTASKRAFDLHNMRAKKKFTRDCRELPMMERQLKCLGLLNPDGSLKTESEMHRVNRYHGGSHTGITTTSRLRASAKQRSPSLVRAMGSIPKQEDQAASNNEEEVMLEVLNDMEQEEMMIPENEEMEQEDEEEEPFIVIPEDELEHAEEEFKMESYVHAYNDE